MFVGELPMYKTFNIYPNYLIIKNIFTKIVIWVIILPLLKTITTNIEC